jgi:hypothetical protein
MILVLVLQAQGAGSVAGSQPPLFPVCADWCVQRVGAEECIRMLDELVDSGLYVDALTPERLSFPQQC